MFNKDKKEKEEPREVAVHGPGSELEKSAEMDEHGFSMVALEESEYGALTKSPSEINAIIKANVGADGLKMGNLTRVKMPSGESTVWQVPSIRGIQTMETIEGIIIHQTDARAYWEKPYGDGEKVPPDCQSQDMFNGVGNPGGACAECKFNKWGSEEKHKRGKACREVKVLYFLPKSKTFLPWYFLLPPTSLATIKNFLLGLASEALRIDEVVTTLGLSMATHGGFEHAVIAPSIPKKDFELSDAEKAVVKAYVAAIRPALERQVTFDQSEVEESRGEGKGKDFE